jgi:hypothetical protein
LELVLNQLTLADRTQHWSDEERWLPELRARRGMRVLGARYEQDTTLMRLAAAVFGAEEPAYLRRSLERLGLPSTSDDQHVQDLAIALFDWDDGRLASVAGLTSPALQEWVDRISVLGFVTGELLVKLWAVAPPPAQVLHAIREIYVWWGIPRISHRIIPIEPHFLNRHPLDFSRPEVRELERLLLTAYPNEKELLYFLRRIGIETARLPLNLGASHLVRELLHVTSRSGELAQLVHYTIEDAPLSVSERLSALVGQAWLDANPVAMQPKPDPLE